MKKFFVSLAFGFICVILLSVKVSAKRAGDFDVIGNEVGYYYEKNILHIISEGDYVISGTTERDSIEVDVHDDAFVTIYLSGVNIDASTKDNVAAFRICAECDPVDIILEDVNSLISGSGRAGLQKDKNSSELTFYGNGTLIAKGGENAAGIGGGIDQEGAQIIIKGGKIKAYGGMKGAGIGGGLRAPGRDIRFLSGHVVAYGGDYGSGIGSGKDCCKQNSIVIKGCTLEAYGGVSGDGIGGHSEYDGNDVNISDSIVRAIGEGDRVGISGELNGRIKISKSFVTAIGGIEMAAYDMIPEVIGDVLVLAGDDDQEVQEVEADDEVYLKNNYVSIIPDL